ncbi:hypothetical protein GE061_003471 [Apolygus lucorum]|uniref:Uncharacterized protein n=1 Tax=Apolygus lucorum TaxID=248454 RepID=A0A6A4JN13_APOLU|nr:hypothetical protein GE061_003471 [Apolygus lucorum]
MTDTHKSLLELKKQQWAREREDMKNYGGIWGNFSDASEPRYRPCIRGTYRSTTDLKNFLDKTPPPVRRRTPSLPPIPSHNYEVSIPK